ncbi:MAG: transglycosylase SLT domain-containing protein [Candidatus Kapaibacterium sp.]
MDDSVASLPMQTNIALQSARLDALQRRTDAQEPGSSALSPEKRAEYAKAARGFESMFVHEMYKTMRQSMLTHDEDADGDGSLGFGNDTLEGFTDLQFADYVSQNGRGMGLAEMMYRHLSGGEHLPSTITQNVRAIAGTTASDQLPGPTVSAVVPSSADKAPRSPMNGIPSGGIPTKGSFLDGLGATGPTGAFLDRMNRRLSSYKDHIAEASNEYHVPPSLIKAIITAESAGNPHAVSPVGAKGLMQLMDGTAKDVEVRNVFDPQENIKGGTRYIARMIRSFGSLEHAVAAYNAGPGNVQKHGGIPPFAETKAYVRKVVRYMQEYKAMEQQASS